ncbi:hypothetical protein BDW72DRAFT_153847 [Aspergillus terricola var. indicus]
MPGYTHSQQRFSLLFQNRQPPIIDRIYLSSACHLPVISVATSETADFGAGMQVTTLGTALFIADFAAGPLFFGTLSELYGHKRLLMAGYAVFIVFQIPVGVAPTSRRSPSAGSSAAWRHLDLCPFQEGPLPTSLTLSSEGWP